MSLIQGVIYETSVGQYDETTTSLPDWTQELLDDPMMYQVPVINERPPVTRLK